MVKYYFQLQNGALNAVKVESRESLKDKIKNEFGGDKAEALKKINSNIEDMNKQIHDLEDLINGKVRPISSKEELEMGLKLATLKYKVFTAHEEKERVEKLEDPDLVFFELTPIEL